MRSKGWTNASDINDSKDDWHIDAELGDDVLIFSQIHVDKSGHQFITQVKDTLVSTTRVLIEQYCLCSKKY